MVFRRLPTPDSRLPTPDSRLPTPDSLKHGTVYLTQWINAISLTAQTD
ncbi:MAG: hypothetical protein F6K50_05740 [Moorea sp. SIO3I7]|nr:hypothetical protein [Moorena sp. SIO3I8]NEN95046.1 hypothetical protein [Moorena sp. SIO3I7]NEO04211.1 hypothetical protein [Moorena sp. SIO3I8]